MQLKGYYEKVIYIELISRMCIDYTYIYINRFILKDPKYTPLKLLSRIGTLVIDTHCEVPSEFLSKVRRVEILRYTPIKIPENNRISNLEVSYMTNIQGLEHLKKLKTLHIHGEFYSKYKARKLELLLPKLYIIRWGC